MRSPRGVRGDDDPATTDEVDLDLGQEGREVPVLLGPELADVTGEPAPPESRGDDIFSGPEQVEDIGAAVLDPALVVGPARRHPVDADAAAIDRELHEPERGDERTGANRSSGEPERSSKDGAPGRPARPGRIDPGD